MNETRTKDELMPGMELTNKDLSKIFHCGNMGGMSVNVNEKVSQSLTKF